MSLFTRRNFLRFGLGAATGVLVDKVIPFNRVWSFPTNIVIPPAIIAPTEEELFESLSGPSIALQLEKVRDMLPSIFEREAALYSMFRGPVTEPLIQQFQLFAENELRDLGWKDVYWSEDDEEWREEDYNE